MAAFLRCAIQFASHDYLRAFEVMFHPYDRPSPLCSMLIARDRFPPHKSVRTFDFYSERRMVPEWVKVLPRG